MFEMVKYFTHIKKMWMINDIRSNVNQSNKRFISTLFVSYNSSKGLVILSSKPKVQDNSEKGGNCRKKTEISGDRRKLPEKNTVISRIKAEIAGKRAKIHGERRKFSEKAEIPGKRRET
jgi:hypothetical protein